MLEVAQWIVIAILAGAVIGLYRQWGHHMLDGTGDIATTSGPRLHRTLPKRSQGRIENVAGPLQSQQTILAFVTENCSGCQMLLTNLGRTERQTQKVIVIAHKPTAAFSEALADLKLPIVNDDGLIWKECEIQATPFLVHLDEYGSVAAKEVNHEIIDRSVEKAS